MPPPLRPATIPPRSNVSAISRRTQHRACKGVSAGECRYFTYNDVNLVEAIEYPGGVANYFWYDAMMRRYAMQDSNGLSYFTWDSNGMNLLCERDSAGSVTAYYTHGFAAVDGIGSGIGQKLNQFGATYHEWDAGRDHRGSVYKRVDANGNITGNFNYDAWGVPLQEEEAGAETRFRYQSNWMKLVDAPDGDLYLSPTRVYLADVGRFLGRDPVARRRTGRIPISFTRLQSVRDNWETTLCPYGVCPNPLVLVDPMGLEWKRVAGGKPLWEARGNKDSLMDLARQVRWRDKKDWVCIMPVGDWKNPDKYPVASCGDRADTSNLERVIPELNNLILHMFKGFWRLWIHRYFPSAGFAANGDAVARAIKKKANAGKTPIHLFWLISHQDGSPGDTSGGENESTQFFVDNLEARSKREADMEGLSGYKLATKPDLPHRCWFARAAAARFWSCKGSRLAKGFAGLGLRRAATARGPVSLLDFGAWELGFNQPGGGWNYYVRVTSALSDPSWSQPFPGKI